MQQLSGLDTVFLNLETRACPMHVGGLAILDPKTAADGFGFDTVMAHVEQRLHLVPAFRRRLVTSPLNLDMPYWIEDPDFDLENHVRHRALPRPGNAEQLAALVCEIVSMPLDRSLPLWRFYFVEGLKGGKVALITKMHHACIDGVSGAEVMSSVLDLSPEPRQYPPSAKVWQPEDMPSPLDLGLATAKALARQPLEAVRLASETLPALFSAGRQHLAARRAARRSRSGQVGGAPRMRFNANISNRRSYAYGSLSLHAIKTIKNCYGVSVNDVVLTICAEALRRYLDEKQELPARPLISGIPVSVRSEEQKGTHGNQVVMARTSLFTDIADPVERLQHISAGMGRIKRDEGAVPAHLMIDWMDVPSPALMAQAARLYENFSIQDVVNPAFNLVISNVPGPRQALYFAGAKLVSNHPVSIPYHGLAFNITVMSYQNQLNYGLTAHRDTLPDIWHFAEFLEQSLTGLHSRAQQEAA